MCDDDETGLQSVCQLAGCERQRRTELAVEYSILYRFRLSGMFRTVEVVVICDSCAGRVKY